MTDKQHLLDLKATPIDDTLNEPQFLNQLNGSYTFLVTTRIPFTDAASSSKYGMFFVAPFPCSLVTAVERHGAVATGPATLDIEKLAVGILSGSGVSMITSTFDLVGAANTVQSKKPTTVSSNAGLDTGDGVALKPSGTLTFLNDVTVTLVLKANTKYLSF
ncbi:MAG TPA: hypothetical protein VMR98_02825 [Candidatus Polarisedimenticolaceae bacterium]|nr:hypothetical protein [Candidatus Polarisedimenticolaceae bacterium]